MPTDERDDQDYSQDDASPARDDQAASRDETFTAAHAQLQQQIDELRRRADSRPAQAPPDANLPRASVGRVVHYVERVAPLSNTLVCRAADITELDPHDPNRVGLFVKSPTSGSKYVTLAVGGVRYDASGQAESRWHWPERT